MQKQAYGWLPSISMGLYNMGRNRALRSEQDAQRAQAHELNDQFRALIAMRSQPMRDNLRGTRMPTVLQAERTPGLLSGPDMPLGYYDQGMIRMASDMGAELADMHWKEAGVLDGFGGLLRGAAGGLKNVAQGTRFGAAALKQRAGKAITQGAQKAVQGVSNAAHSAQAGVQNIQRAAREGAQRAATNVQQSAKSIGPSLKQRAQAVSDNVGNKMTAFGNKLEAKGQAAGTSIGRAGAGIKTPTPDVATQAPKLSLNVAKPKPATPALPSGAGSSPKALNTVGSGAPPKQLPAAPVAKQLPQRSSAQAAPTQAAAPAGNPQVAASKPSQLAAPGTQQAAAPPTQVVPAQKVPVTPTPQPASNSSAATAPHQPPPSPEQPETQPAGKPGFLERTQKDLGDGKWGYKLPMLAAAGAASYGLYRGAKGVVNYMGKEQQPARFNEGGVVPPQQVNQYGVPERVN